MGKYIAWKMKAAICDDTVEDAAFMEKHIKEYFMVTIQNHPYSKMKLG